MPPHFTAVIVLTMLAAYICVAYWRTALRIAVVMIITLAIYGAVLVIEALHHVVK